MTQQARERTRDLRSLVTGTYAAPAIGFSTTDSCPMGDEEYCYDILGNGSGDNPLWLEKKSSYYFVLNGEYVDPYGVVRDKFVNFPISGRVLPRTDFPSDWVNPDLIAIGHQAAARTNPNKEIVNLPQFIGEMRDFSNIGGIGASPDAPIAKFQRAGKSSLARKFVIASRANARFRNNTSLARDTARLGGIPAVTRAAARANLGWRFALAPFIGDLEKLLRFQELAENKGHYLRRLQNRPIYTRTSFGEDSFIERSEPDYMLHSQDAWVHATICTHFSREHWATVRWTADALAEVWPTAQMTNAKKVLNPHLLGLASALGTHDYGAIKAAWELIPWSWMHDWFADYSAWLGAYTGGIPVSIDGMCYMSTLRSHTWLEHVIKPSWLSLDGRYVQTVTRKIRIPIPNYVLFLPPLTSVNGLGRSQIAILGSLAVLGSL